MADAGGATVALVNGIGPEPGNGGVAVGGGINGMPGGDSSRSSRTEVGGPAGVAPSPDGQVAQSGGGNGTEGVARDGQRGGAVAGLLQAVGGAAAGTGGAAGGGVNTEASAGGADGVNDRAQGTGHAGAGVGAEAGEPGGTDPGTDPHHHVHVTRAGFDLLRDDAAE